MGASFKVASNLIFSSLDVGTMTLGCLYGASWTLACARSVAGRVAWSVASTCLNLELIGREMWHHFGPN